jgi:hypothetical protein
LIDFSIFQTPFVILGHGEENILTNFTKREQLSPGYILVTLAECGAVTTEDIVTKFVNAFKQPTNANTFADPIHHTKQIETLLGNTIHIYLEGDFIPNLTVQTFLDWEGSHDTKLMKSGLYRFPLNPSLFTDPLLKTYPVTIPYSGKIPAELPVRELFHESIFPTYDTIMKTKLGIISDFKKSVTFPLRDILLQGGPGVYYYVICRAPIGFNSSIFNTGLLENNISKKCRNASNIIPILPNTFEHFNSNHYGGRRQLCGIRLK